MYKKINLITKASVIGFEFDIGVLQGIYKDKKFVNDIKLLQQQNFIIQSGPSSFTFRSELVCRVAYSRLLVSKRKQLHKQIAEWYESQSKSKNDIFQYCQLLAHHWFEAFSGQEDIDENSLKKVIEYIRISADQATQLLSTEEAASLLRRGLQFLQQLSNPSKRIYEKKLKLQLMGLPVRNLHGYSIRDQPGVNQINFKRLAQSQSITANIIHPKVAHGHKNRSSTMSQAIKDFNLPSFSKVNTLSVDFSSNHRLSIDYSPDSPGRESKLQGILKRKSEWTGRWKSVYCVVRGNSFW